MSVLLAERTLHGCSIAASAEAADVPAADAEARGACELPAGERPALDHPVLGHPALGHPVLDPAARAAPAPETVELGTPVASDAQGMELALRCARQAEAEDEVPVGAIVVLDGRVVGRAWNRTRGACDPTAHAEIRAVAEAARLVGAMRLPGAVVYATLEPCFMCAGALVHARIARVVWAVRDPKFGGARSLGNVLDDPRSNHRVEITEGVGADESRTLLQQFFQKKRERADGR